MYDRAKRYFVDSIKDDIALLPQFLLVGLATFLILLFLSWADALKWVWYAGVGLVAVAVLLGLAIVAAAHIASFLPQKPWREKYPSLTDQDCEKVLSKIDTFSPDASNAALLIDAEAFRSNDVPDDAGSRVGGRPYGATPQLPQRQLKNIKFLAQIRLPEWLPASPWSGDLLVIFRVGWNEHDVLRYPSSELQAVSEQLGELSSVPYRPLYEMRLPRVPYGKNGRYRNLYNPKLMLKHVAGLGNLLSAHTSDPEQLLSHLLGPESTWGESFDRIQVGGHPHWVQGPEYPNCTVCGKRTQFLAQLGDTASSAFAKQFEGVIYLFGCPQHPDQIVCQQQFD